MKRQFFGDVYMGWTHHFVAAEAASYSADHSKIPYDVRDEETLDGFMKIIGEAAKRGEYVAHKHFWEPQAKTIQYLKKLGYDVQTRFTLDKEKVVVSTAARWDNKPFGTPPPGVFLLREECENWLVSPSRKRPRKSKNPCPTTPKT